MNDVEKMSKMEVFRYILLFLYFLSISAFRSGIGFDDIFTKVIFVVIAFFSIFQKNKIVVYTVLIWNICFWVFFLISSIWAADSGDTFVRIGVAIQTVGIFWFLPTYIKDKKSLIIVLKILLSTLVVTAVILLVRTPFDSFGVERLGASIGMNANELGMKMAVGALILVYLLHEQQDKTLFQKIIYILIGIVFFILTLFSGSKKALFALVIGVIIYEILLAKGMKVFLKIIYACLGLLLIVLLMFNNPQLYNVLGRRVEATFTTLDGTASSHSVDRSLAERQFYIEQGLDLFERHPLLGYGGNNFIEYMEEINYHHVAYSHNNYVELLSTLGIVGFIIYYSFWIYVGWCMIKICIQKLKKKQKDPLLFLFIILFIIFLILDYAMVSYDSSFYMVLLCMMYMYCYLHKKGVQNKERICIE